MNLNLYDEISTLKSVILGNAYTLGNKPKINQTYDPSSIIHLKKEKTTNILNIEISSK